MQLLTAYRRNGCLHLIPRLKRSARKQLVYDCEPDTTIHKHMEEFNKRVR